MTVSNVQRNAVAIAIASALAFASYSARAAGSAPTQLLIDPDFAVMKTSDQQAVAQAWLKANRASLRVSDLAQLQLRETKDSLTARHFYYQQMLNGIPLLNAEVIVSVSHGDARVSKVFNSAQAVELPAQLNKTAGLKSEQAQESAWEHLQASGLQHLTDGQLVYVSDDNGIHLAYRVQISAQQPHGVWDYLIDASSAQVLKAARMDTPKKPEAEIIPGQFINKNHTALAQEVALLKQSQSAAQKTSVAKAVADGKANVFDPDPRTTMNDASLTDKSSIPDAAYLLRNLKDLTVDAGVYSLNGPWVKIVELEAPVTTPSTTIDGDWSAFRRGVNAFNDAMTYFHIDQNQRYIQSLGFSGSKGIQQRSISVDTDGYNGDDNSRFDRIGNDLAFGHGGVDDNEDADVILHEYGHALQYSMNNNWAGGDAGAMGEGFGDYWGGSYSLTTTNGNTFNRSWAFTWDGHSSDTWTGRFMDKTSYRYNSSKTYEAHKVVDNVLGDELWSTALFQSLLDLIAQGRTREEVDRIILEAHFGFGANVKMHQIAASVLQAANALYPSGPHAAVFRARFEQMNLLNQAPSIQFSNASQTVTSGSAVNVNATVTDADGDTVSLLWTRISGPEVTLSGATTNSVSFTAPEVATSQTLKLQLVATDSKNTANTQTVNVTINPAPSSGGGGGGGGGSMPLLTGAAALLSLLIRRARRS